MTPRSIVEIVITLGPLVTLWAPAWTTYPCRLLVALVHSQLFDVEAFDAGKAAKYVANPHRMVQDDLSPARDLTCSRVILGKTNGQNTDEDSELNNTQPAGKAADSAGDAPQEHRDDRKRCRRYGRPRWVAAVVAARAQWPRDLHDGVQPGAVDLRQRRPGLIFGKACVCKQ